MQLQHHKTLTIEKWQSFTKGKQILMIANEMNRLMNNILASFEIKELKDCLERIFELIDITVSCQKGNCRKELLRFRELFANFYILDDNVLSNSYNEILKFYRVLLQFDRNSAMLLD